MKRCRISIITMVGILGLFLCGCGSGKEEQDLKAEGELTFYCMEDDERAALYMFEFKSRYPNITVNRVTFDDSSKMDDKVKTELNAGTGPDVILFSSKNSLDVLDMAKQGAFLALNEEMAEDKLLEEDDYLPGTFEAGKVDGKVYALPITFSIPFLTYDKTEELGFEPGPVISFEEYCEAIAEDIERLKGDDTHRTLYCQRYFRSLLGAAQVYAVSVEDQSVTIDAEGLKKTIDEIARFEDGVEEANTFMERYVKIEPELPGHFTFLYHVYSDVTQAVCLWENLCRADGIKEMGLSVIGNADQGGTSVFDLHRNGIGSCIDGIFHQLFHNGSRTLYHLTGRNLIYCFLTQQGNLVHSCLHSAAESGSCNSVLIPTTCSSACSADDKWYSVHQSVSDSTHQSPAIP